MYYKTINLIKIQRSNERVLQLKESRFERHKDTPRLRVDAYFFLISVIKNIRIRIQTEPKTNGPQICCIPHES